PPCRQRRGSRNGGGRRPADWGPIWWLRREYDLRPSTGAASGSEARHHQSASRSSGSSPRSLSVLHSALPRLPVGLAAHVLWRYRIGVLRRRVLWRSFRNGPRLCPRRGSRRWTATRRRAASRGGLRRRRASGNGRRLRRLLPPSLVDERPASDRHSAGRVRTSLDRCLHHPRQDEHLPLLPDARARSIVSLFQSRIRLRSAARVGRLSSLE